MKKLCSICGELVEYPEAKICDNCWYGMRLEPKEWKEKLKKQGITVKYQGGCIPFSGGQFRGIFCRDPYIRVKKKI